jgi:phytoene desaturase
MNNNRVLIIGGGIGGLGIACLLGKAGYDVTLVEKNEKVGGRCNRFSAEGYTFDMGPSWYLMPDVFEQFFEVLGEDIHDHLELKRLSPSYRVFFKDEGKQIDLYSDLEKDIPTLSQFEEGVGPALKDYLARAEMQYDIAKDKFMYKNYDSWRDLMSKELLIDGWKLSVFTYMDRYVKKFFDSDQVQKIMQYPLVFLGSSPYNTPAIYNIMSHVDFNLGVFYPQGGMYEVALALERIAKRYDVELRTDCPVERILVEGGEAVGVALADSEELRADAVISNANIWHTETQLLPESARSFDEDYWEKRTLAPSALIMYLGVDGEVDNLQHHNLVFSKDWKKNFSEIFDAPRWPTDPSLYVCAPGNTDPSVAPDGKENLFVLVPIASGLEYSQSEKEAYAERILQTMEETMDIPNLRERIEYKRLFCVEEFAERYNSYKGSALGLAHTVKQTAIFRPDTKSKTLPNLYYVGANTNPGIGVPTCLISAQLVYKRMIGDKSAGPMEPLA